MCFQPMMTQISVCSDICFCVSQKKEMNAGMERHNVIKVFRFNIPLCSLNNVSLKLVENIVDGVLFYIIIIYIVFFIFYIYLNKI